MEFKPRSLSGQELTQIGVYSRAVGVTSNTQLTEVFTLDHEIFGWIQEESFQIKIDDVDKLILVAFVLTDGLVPENVLSTSEVHSLMLFGNQTGEHFAQYHLERPVFTMVPPDYEGVVEVIREVHRAIKPNIPSEMSFSYSTFNAQAPTTGGVIELLYYNKLAVACDHKH